MADVRDSVLRISKDGTLLEYVPLVGESVADTRASSSLGKQVRETMPAEFALSVMPCVEAALDSREAQVCEFQLMESVDQQEVPVYEARVGIAGPNEALVTLRDVTERKRLELKLSQAQKMEVVGRLTGGIAHDFNKLLTPIVAYSDLMGGMLAVGSQPHTYLGEIKNAAMRAANLTRQLLSFSRRETVKASRLDLNDVAANTRAWLKRLVPEDIELVVIPAEELGPVRAYHGQIEQVVMNLVLNAVDAMPNGGELVMQLGTETFAATDEMPGDYVFLAVSDTGAGMCPEVIAQVYDPFFTTKETGKGTGLGPVDLL